LLGVDGGEAAVGREDHLVVVFCRCGCLPRGGVGIALRGFERGSVGDGRDEGGRLERRLRRGRRVAWRRPLLLPLGMVRPLSERCRMRVRGGMLPLLLAERVLGGLVAAKGWRSHGGERVRGGVLEMARGGRERRGRLPRLLLLERRLRLLRLHEVLRAHRGVEAVPVVVRGGMEGAAGGGRMLRSGARRVGLLLVLLLLRLTLLLLTRVRVLLLLLVRGSGGGVLRSLVQAGQGWKLAREGDEGARGRAGGRPEGDGQLLLCLLRGFVLLLALLLLPSRVEDGLEDRIVCTFAAMLCAGLAMGRGSGV
jgi:hypothetical protein